MTAGRIVNRHTPGLRDPLIAMRAETMPVADEDDF